MVTKQITEVTDGCDKPRWYPQQLDHTHLFHSHPWMWFGPGWPWRCRNAKNCWEGGSPGDFFSVFFSKWSKGNQGNQTLVCLKLVVTGRVRHKDVWHCFTHCKHGKYHFLLLLVSGVCVNVLLWTCAHGWCYGKDGWEDVNVPCTLIDGGCYAMAGGGYAMVGVGKGMVATHYDGVG